MKLKIIRQIWIMSKYAIYGITLQCLFYSLLLAEDGYGQHKSIEDIYLSVKLEKVPVETIFSDIEKKTDFSFVYHNVQVKHKTLSINEGTKSLAELLRYISKETNLKFKRINENIYVSQMKKGVDEVNSNYDVEEIQQVLVSGKVVSAEDNEPLPGVNIIIKGSNTGTTTNIDGAFSLNVSQGNILQFSYIGFISKEIAITTESELTIVLAPDLEQLEEVIVVGYGTQKKENLTGAVGTANLDDIDSRPITSSSAVLQGKISGVYALQKSGKPGGDDAVINIRGVGTLNNSNPLVLVDGFPSNINDVNPNDIKSISVLKDAASAAIYGNRAANGVIIITTKRGAANKTSITYNNYFGVQNATRLPEVLNSYEYTTLYNEASANTGMQPRYTDEEIQKYADGSDPMYPSINYFDVYYDQATIQNHRISLTGGSDNLKYAFMGGYLDQEGILVGTSYKKVDFRSNMDAYFLSDDKLRVSARMSGNRGITKEPTDEWNAKWYATNSPVWPLKNGEDQWVAVIGERNYYGEIQEGSTREIERYTFNGQVEAEYEIIDGLSAQITSGFNVVTANNNAFHANVLLANLDGSTRSLTSDLTETNDLNTQTLFTGLLKYKKAIGKHELNLLAGYQEEEFQWKWSNGYRNTFINNTQRYLNLGDASTMQNNAGAYDLGLQSVFGRINYSYAGKYLFEANVRRDGSSRFGEGYKWGTFPSFSVGWMLSDEAFLQDVSWMDQLKLRASWGRLGNQNINNYYAASDILSAGTNYSFGGNLNSGVAITSMTNKQTTWETTKQINVGVDMTINQNIDITIDYFNKTTEDILMQIPIPVTLGNLSPPYQNVGEVVNKGIEFTGTYRKIFANDLRFSTTVTLASIKNEITNLNGRSPIINGVSALVEGSPIHSFYGYEQDGIYQIDDFTWQDNSNSSILHEDRQYTLKEGVVAVANFTAQPGDVKFKDQTGDGIVTTDDDRKVIGNQYPDLAYSAQFNLEWKNFDLGFFFQGVQGIEGYTYYEIATPFSGAASNMGSWWLDRWTPESPSNELPRLTLDGVRNNIHSTLYMEDASYLRLKNIEIGYSLPNNVLSAIGIGSLRVFGNVQNVFTITKYKGFDPEQTTGETRAQAYPQVRMFTAGLNVNF
ncbi:SusC/RagA family TonB-linked outer membrane protein [Flammeovirgaceae bacterium SG7u.111]|nr:SusC/RagA family TonB-linked outer membrane protein [Flammeovirgaceae bacterium SG7u.132]WPO33722.1 SusC/RagA family TonB-linked outer membrane protein [Flammeovirgaceae bacterium SG7u.111]